MLTLNPLRRGAPWAALALGAATIIAVPSTAQANCHQRKVTGAIAGTVGGALIGNSISHGAGGTLLGAGLGALAGHTIAGATCHDEYYHHAYYRRRYHRHYRYEARYEGAGYATAAPPSECYTQQTPYYDAYGRLIYRPTQICR